MKTEEIEKAAEEFCVNRRLDSKGYPPSVWFKAGAEFSDKHWQEKTRWISVGERLPEVRETPYWVVAKTESGDDCVVVKIRNEGFFEYLKTYFTYWKEIEL